MSEYEENFENAAFSESEVKTEGGNGTLHQPGKKSKKGVRGIAICLCCALVGGVIGAGGFALGMRAGGGSVAAGHTSDVYVGQRESTVINLNYVDTSQEMTAAEVYAANVNSTVGISTTVTTNIFGFQTTTAASGSGFIISEDGYILTNYHVVEDSSSITVSLYDGSSYEAELVGYDESNDIAVLKVEADGLTPVILGDSDNMNVGDMVVAIGNPLGELTFSLTTGVVSALDRYVTLSSSISMSLIQTDCAINSGNSGGALFNLYGEVIGITNAKYSSSSSSGASIDNIGFAIPINSIRSIVESIIEKGYITSPYIGVYISDVSQEAINYYGLPEGAVVVGVVEDSPAETAGLAANDIITAVNGSAVSGSSDLSEVVGKAAAGDQLILTVYRKGETLELTVEVGEQIKSALANEEAQTQSEGQQSRLPGQGRGQNSGQGSDEGEEQSSGQGSSPWMRNNG